MWAGMVLCAYYSRLKIWYGENVLIKRQIYFLVFLGVCISSLTRYKQRMFAINTHQIYIFIISNCLAIVCNNNQQLFGTRFAWLRTGVGSLLMKETRQQTLIHVGVAFLMKLPLRTNVPILPSKEIWNFHSNFPQLS